MRLRGINFNHVSNASGALNFFGDGYPFHHLFKWFGLNFTGSGFVAKTTTMRPRLGPPPKRMTLDEISLQANGLYQGNMPLQEDRITPRELLPKSIVVTFRKGSVLNAVGLTGPGAPALLEMGLWQRRTKPFWISFMSVERTKSDRLTELSEFVILIEQHVNAFSVRFGLEVNFSCPNVGLDPTELMDEIGQSLNILGALTKVPIQIKLNVLAPPEAVCEVARHKACDSVCMGNTIPWGALPERIDWKGIFGGTISPLARMGGGGLSSGVVVPLTCEWIREARDLGFTKPIIACNGIYSKQAVRQLHKAGASGMQLGCIGILRPWRMRPVIELGYELFYDF